MDQILEEVLRCKKVLEKETSDAVDIMQCLDSLLAVDIDADVLRKTMIGKCVNGITKQSTEQDVKGKGRALLAKWKAAVGHKPKPRPAEDAKGPEPEKPKEEVKPPKPETKSVEDFATKVVAPSATPSTPSASPQDEVHEDGRQTFGFDGQDLTTIFHPEVVGNPKRDNVRKKLFEVLRPREEPEDAEPAVLAAEIEQALQEQLWPSGEDRVKVEFKAYMDQTRSVLFNLKDVKNLTFRKKVLVGAVAAGDIPRLTPVEMASEAKNSERKEMLKYAAEAVQSDWAKRNGQMQVSGMFTCGRCKGSKTTYFQMQTRSSDEPMTTYVTCLICANRWKFC